MESIMQKVIVQILRAPLGGIRKHVFDIINSLEKKDVQQVFITNTKDADKDLPLIKNLIIYHVDIKDQPSIKDFVNIVKIYKFLKNFNVIVLHGHGAKGGTYARIISLFFKAKSIYTPHGGSLHRSYGTLKNKFYSLVELILVPLTDLFLFESHYSSNEFSKNVCRIKNKSVVNYNGVDIPLLQANRFYQDHHPLKLASFGFLRHLKGHDIAIKTCALLVEYNIPFEYCIYGQGEESENLLTLIKKFNLQEYITIKNYSGAVVEEMLHYDFIFHPSRFESFGYVPVEAMSVKIPVIASAEGGLKEVLDQECSYISEKNTPESYCEIIKKIYEGDLTLKLKIENAFNKVKTNFSIDVMLAKIEDVYFS